MERMTTLLIYIGNVVAEKKELFIFVVFLQRHDRITLTDCLNCTFKSNYI